MNNAQEAIKLREAHAKHTLSLKDFQARLEKLEARVSVLEARLKGKEKPSA